MAARGWTPKEVEARGIAHSTLFRYMRPTPLKQPLRKSTMVQLANALDLPLGEVQRAAVDSVGYVYGEQSVAPPAVADAPLEPTSPIANIIQAVRDNEALRPEAKAHLINQVELLLLINGPASEALAALQEQRRLDALVQEVGTADVVRHLRSEGSESPKGSSPKRPTRGLR